MLSVTLSMRFQAVLELFEREISAKMPAEGKRIRVDAQVLGGRPRLDLTFEVDGPSWADWMPNRVFAMTDN